MGGRIERTVKVYREEIVKVQGDPEGSKNNLDAHELGVQVPGIRLRVRTNSRLILVILTVIAALTIVLLIIFT